MSKRERERRLDTWQEFAELVSGESYRNWAFRGQADARWDLLPTLARYLRQYGVHESTWHVQEERALRVFKRKARLYSAYVPNEEYDFEWLALMQHHGTPTRLLDLTWSPYVAAFFALERAATKEAAVWALHVPSISWSEEHAKISLRRGGAYQKYFLENELSLVWIGEPEVMNDRLTAQSGTFAVPTRIDRSLDQLIWADPETELQKLILPTATVRRQAMRELYNMNITHATLFPGLDGLARSLAYELEFHWAFDPYTGQQIL